MTGRNNDPVRQMDDAERGGTDNSIIFAQEYFNDLPVDMEAMIVQDMEDLEMDRAMIYAFQHTGMLVTDDTLGFYTEDQLTAWQSAIDRYRRLTNAAA